MLAPKITPATTPPLFDLAAPDLPQKARLAHREAHAAGRAQQVRITQLRRTRPVDKPTRAAHGRRIHAEVMVKRARRRHRRALHLAQAFLRRRPYRTVERHTRPQRPWRMAQLADDVAFVLMKAQSCACSPNRGGQTQQFREAVRCLVVAWLRQPPATGTNPR